MFGKTVQLEGDVDVAALLPGLYRTGPVFFSKGGVARAVLLDHDRYMELYEAAQRGTRQQGPAAGDASV